MRFFSLGVLFLKHTLDQRRDTRIFASVAGNFPKNRFLLGVRARLALISIFAFDHLSAFRALRISRQRRPRENGLLHEASALAANLILSLGGLIVRTTDLVEDI